MGPSERLSLARSIVSGGKVQRLQLLIDLFPLRCYFVYLEARACVTAACHPLVLQSKRNHSRDHSMGDEAETHAKTNLFPLHSLGTVEGLLGIM